MKNQVKPRRHVRVRGVLFTKDGQIRQLKQLRAMKKAVKDGYSVISVTNSMILKAKRKNDLYNI